MKIANNKKYRTRSGYPVVIDRKRSGSQWYPVTGRVLGIPGGDVYKAWTSDGGGRLGKRSRYDLIEVEK